VVAIAAAKIKKVICLTCQDQHAFRKTPPASKNKTQAAGAAGSAEPKPKAPRVSRAPRKPTEPKGQVKKPTSSELEVSNRMWQDLKEALGSGRRTPYSIHGSFEVGQALVHSRFGIGFVTKVLPPNKIEVLFEPYSKILIMMVKEDKAE
jgi:hypothetical protein